MKKSYETPTCQSYEFKVEEDILTQSPITSQDTFDTGGTEIGGGNYEKEEGSGVLFGN